MDTLIVGGDHYTGVTGLPVSIDGDAELIQRALIRLSVRRGALSGAPRLGSELHLLRRARPEALERLALSYAQEALAPMGELSVQKAAVSRKAEGIAVAVTVSHRRKTYQLEVQVT